MNLASRSECSELMDTEVVTSEDFAACLRDLATVNRLTFATRPTLTWLNQVTRDWPTSQTLSILDVGYGQGDMLRAIWKWAKKRGIKVKLEGIDLNPLSEIAAKQATPKQMNILFQTGDVFSLASERSFDIIISSLVAHHLSDEQIVSFISLLERQVTLGWFINDLHRHVLSYYAFRLWSALAGWHRFVRHDGPVSIARSFRRKDWQSYLAAAGIDACIKWHMPFRYSVGQIKSRLV